MRGRKPTPTRLKLIHGNPGNRPLNPNKPEPRAAIPTCPSHLRSGCPARRSVDHDPR